MVSVRNTDGSPETVLCQLKGQQKSDLRVQHDISYKGIRLSTQTAQITTTSLDLSSIGVICAEKSPNSAKYEVLTQVSNNQPNMWLMF